MAKKHKHPDHVNHERWLVSYADFITLLFAFFVVMFSTSQSDSNKVGRYAESFVEAMGVHVLQGSMGVFDGTNSPFAMMQKSGVKHISNQKTKLGEIEIQMQALKSIIDSAPDGASAEAAMAAFAAGAKDAKLSIAIGNGKADQEGAGKGKPKGGGGEGEGEKNRGRGGEKDGEAGGGGHADAEEASAGKQQSGNRESGDDGPGDGNGGDGDKGTKTGAEKPDSAPVGFRILRRRSELVLRLDIDILFRSGADEIDPRALPLLEALGRELKEKPVLVKVEGHADNRPIHTTRFPSNWHLSSARATAVVLMLMGKAGVAPERLAASGLGEHQPLATNDTEAGRAKNRRVDIVIGLDPVYEDSEAAEEAAKGTAKTAEEAARQAGAKRADEKADEQAGTKPAKAEASRH